MKFKGKIICTLQWNLAMDFEFNTSVFTAEE